MAICHCTRFSQVFLCPLFFNVALFFLRSSWSCVFERDASLWFLCPQSGGWTTDRQTDAGWSAWRPHVEWLVLQCVAACCLSLLCLDHRHSDHCSPGRLDPVPKRRAERSDGLERPVLGPFGHQTPSGSQTTLLHSHHRCCWAITHARTHSIAHLLLCTTLQPRLTHSTPGHSCSADGLAVRRSRSPSGRHSTPPQQRRSSRTTTSTHAHI